MKKKLYYVVEKGTTVDVTGDEVVTGFKNITVYEIEDSIPSRLTVIDCELSDSSIEEIQKYLNDNGMGDDDFEFIQL